MSASIIFANYINDNVVMNLHMLIYPWMFPSVGKVEEVFIHNDYSKKERNPTKYSD